MNTTLVKSAVQRLDVTPMSSPPRLDEIREDMLVKAGFTPKVLERSVRAIDEALDAHKTTHFAKDGVVMDSKHDIDHNTRIRAAEQAFTLANAYPSRSSSSGVGKVEVVVVAPNWLPPGRS
jgi:hypothetical protein